MLKNQELVKMVLNMILTLQESGIYIKAEFERTGDVDSLRLMGRDMLAMLDAIYPVAVSFVKENKGNDEVYNVPFIQKLNTDIACVSVRDSLVRLLEKPERSEHKLEYEFIPLLRNMYQNLYFKGCIFPDQDLINHYIKFQEEIDAKNYYLEKSLQTSQFKYDMSIVVLAYNKLEYTKLCVENILKYPFTLGKSELILINHGSTDGTKEYFESIKPDKQLDIKVNGGGVGAWAYIAEGRYSLIVSNDVVVTKNAIDNMYKCICSDETICRVVPTTTGISNLQTIPCNFQNLDEMYMFAEKNNVYDVYRHEQRVRLCDPISLTDYTKGCALLSGGSDWSQATIFPDDYMSYRIRVANLKSILQKDAFCYHFGSISLKDEITAKNQKEFYDRGRKLFEEEIGIDPWGTGFCFSPELIEQLPCNNSGHVNILGVNCGMGSNPLKVREEIKERVHNLDVSIYNITDAKKYKTDLESVGDFVRIVLYERQVLKAFSEEKFDYIILEDAFEIEMNDGRLLKNLKSRLTENGILAVRDGIGELQSLQVEDWSLKVAGAWGILYKQGRSGV